MSAVEEPPVDPTDPGPAGGRAPNTPADELAERRRATAPPPHDLDAERALLAAALIDPAAAASAVASLPADAWYAPAHSHIAHAITSLDAAGDPIDPILVADHLDQLGVLDQIGGHATLSQIVDAGGLPTSAPAYAQVVRGHWQLRQVLHATDQARAAVADRNLTAALHALEAALDQPADTTAASLAGLLDHHLDLLEARQSGETSAIPTGLTDVDQIIDGLRPGELYIVAGRPGMGKSAFGGQLALNLATIDIRVLYVTIEMSTVELTDRWLANLSGVDIRRIHRGQLDTHGWDAIAQATGTLAQLPIDVLDAPDVDLARIRSAARATGAQAVIVDYLQLIVAGRTSNRQEEVAEVARGAKNLARALDVPVVALAQLHRGVEARIEKRPTLADLRDSGEIENSAGVVIGLYRHDYYHPGAAASRGREVEAIVLKNRHGTTGTAHLAFRGAWQQITGLDRRRGA